MNTRNQYEMAELNFADAGLQVMVDFNPRNPLPESQIAVFPGHHVWIGFHNRISYSKKPLLPVWTPECRDRELRHLKGWPLALRLSLAH